MKEQIHFFYKTSFACIVANILISVLGDICSGNEMKQDSRTNAINVIRHQRKHIIGFKLLVIHVYSLDFCLLRRSPERVLVWLQLYA